MYISSAQCTEPNKRPLSTITPTIVEDEHGNLELAVGGSGGSQILTATLNVILNTYDFGQNVYEAVKAPRIHHQLIPNEAQFETGYSDLVLEELLKKGHQVKLFFFWSNLFFFLRSCLFL